MPCCNPLCLKEVTVSYQTATFTVNYCEEHHNELVKLVDQIISAISGLGQKQLGYNLDISLFNQLQCNPHFLEQISILFDNNGPLLLQYKPSKNKRKRMEDEIPLAKKKRSKTNDIDILTKTFEQWEFSPISDEFDKFAIH